jgi:hypothetical protein
MRKIYRNLAMLVWEEKSLMALENGGPRQAEKNKAAARVVLHLQASATVDCELGAESGSSKRCEATCLPTESAC